MLCTHMKSLVLFAVAQALRGSLECGEIPGDRIAPCYTFYCDQARCARRASSHESLNEDLVCRPHPKSDSEYTKTGWLENLLVYILIYIHIHTYMRACMLAIVPHQLIRSFT